MDDVTLPGWTRHRNARVGFSYRYVRRSDTAHRLVERHSVTGEWVVYEWVESFSGSGWKALDMTFDDPTAAMAWATVELSNG